MANADGEPSAVAYLALRVRRRLAWARAGGVGALVEEQRLNPVERTRIALSKYRWRRRHGVTPGTATPVYVVGLQRSGTNMVLRGLDRAPEFEVHNESDRHVFHRYQLRSDLILVDTVLRSRHPYVLFKPLCDSHRTPELLALPDVRPGKAIWIYRDVDDRARSSIAKFDDSGLQAVRRVIAGDGAIWQGRCLSHDTLRQLREFPPDTLTRETAAALLWYARNSLYFELGLDRRHDVFPLSYDRFVADPDGVGRELCRFLGLPWRQELFAHVQRRHAVSQPLPVDPAARELCDAMRTRLDHVASAAVWSTREEAGL